MSIYPVLFDPAVRVSADDIYDLSNKLKFIFYFKYIILYGECSINTWKVCSSRRVLDLTIIN